MTETFSEMMARLKSIQDAWNLNGRRGTGDASVEAMLNAFPQISKTVAALLDYVEKETRGGWGRQDAIRLLARIERGDL